MIDLELVRARWKKNYGRRSGKTIESIVEFLGSLAANPHSAGVYLLHQMSDYKFVIKMFHDVSKQMGFPPIKRTGMLNYKMGPYIIRFVSKANKRALLGISDWAMGFDHSRYP